MKRFGQKRSETSAQKTAQASGHRAPEADRADQGESAAKREAACAAAAIVLSVAGLFVTLLMPQNLGCIIALLGIAVAALLTMRAVSLARFQRSLLPEPLATLRSRGAKEAALFYDRRPIPHMLTSVAAAACVVAIVGSACSVVYSFRRSNIFFDTMKTWTLDDEGGWRRNGAPANFTIAESTPSASASGAVGTSIPILPSSSATGSDTQLQTNPMASVSGTKVGNDAVTRNNPATDTDDSSALKVVGVSLDNYAYGYYNGWVELRNNTDETVLNADVAITMLTNTSTILSQGDAHCTTPIEPGQTGRAYLQMKGSGAAALIPYTTVWYTPGDSTVSADDDQYTDSSSTSSIDFAASRTTPGTVFHKASPGVPAIKLH